MFLQGCIAFITHHHFSSSFFLYFSLSFCFPFILSSSLPSTLPFPIYLFLSLSLVWKILSGLHSWCLPFIHSCSFILYFFFPLSYSYIHSLFHNHSFSKRPFFVFSMEHFFKTAFLVLFFYSLTCVGLPHKKKILETTSRGHSQDYKYSVIFLSFSTDLICLVVNM